MKTYSLEDLVDKCTGRKGTERRDEFEYELCLDLIGKAIKRARKEKRLTQEAWESLSG